MKLTKKLTLLFMAATLAITPTVATIAAPTEIVEAKKAPKISKTELALDKGASAKLKIKNTNKKAKWASDNEAVATVNKKGKVTAVDEGLATITATVGKKEFTCVVTVTDPSLKDFEYDPANFEVNSTAIWYHGAVLDEEAEYYLDDVKQTEKVNPMLDSETPNCNLFWNEALTDGDHVFTIKKEGYRTFTYAFTYEAPKFEGVFVDFYGEGSRYNVFGDELWVQINPSLDGVEMNYAIDGTAVEPKWVDFNGDGCLSAVFDVPAAGTHTIEAFMGELKADKMEIVIEEAAVVAE